MIITIDGPIATGKSTIARRLAEQIGYIYFDTGGMYRGLTYALLRDKINLDDEQAIVDYLKTFNLDIKIKHGALHFYVGSEDVTEELRKPEVTQKVSRVSAIPAVREKLVAFQRELASGVNAVFEGRDMGTVVFPDAQFKVFLTGRPEVRAKRRYEEMCAKFPDLAKTLTMEQMTEEINRRDTLDSTREISPLHQAEDACVIDTTDLTIDEVVYKILEYKDTLKRRRSGSSIDPSQSNYS